MPVRVRSIPLALQAGQCPAEAHNFRSPGATPGPATVDRIRRRVRMRPDMAQIIIERPRGGWRYKTPKGSRRRLQRGLDDGPRREGIKRIWGGGKKWLSEHLSPLRRFLLSRVGRPWDQVFAEICQHIRVDSAVQDHVRDHLWDSVERYVILVDGEPCFGGGWRHGRPLRGSRTDLYVCPRTGLLRHVPAAALSCQCRRIRGAWHLITLSPIGAPRHDVMDVLLGQRVSALGALRLRREYGGPYFALSMRQLTRTELRSLPVRY